MKIVLFSLLFLILVGMTLYSYAQSVSNPDLIVPDKDSQLPVIMLQLVLRDSNGILISYVEAEQITGMDGPALHRFLDNLNLPNKEFFIKDDTKYEILQWEKAHEKYDETLIFSGSRLIDIYQNEYLQVLSIRHDSFTSHPGDTLRVFYTIIRPAS